MSALKKFTQEDSFSFGLVATGSMTDPTRRWSQGSIPEIDLLFYLAAEKRESYDPNKLAAFLQETLGWSCDFSEGHKAWDEYDDTHPPYFKLVPQTGRYIELHPDWEIWQTPQDIRSLIGQIRSSNRGEQLRNPYFCVLIEP